MEGAPALALPAMFASAITANPQHGVSCMLLPSWWHCSYRAGMEPEQTLLSVKRWRCTAILGYSSHRSTRAVPMQDKLEVIATANIIAPRSVFSHE